MLRTGILHPQLAKVLAEVRHKDTILIGDAGLPIPKGVERIDLGWKEGSPGYLEVLKEVLKYLIVEEAIFANEAKQVSPTFHQEATSLFDKEVPLKYISHDELKESSKESKAIILTGEFTPYTNVILVCGCAY